ncbi:unnamed protein product [Rangifer tarandus platyrhynchus]|uniref:Uncharacterized protein n=2 Tax=Rangifer tarandus platyrhynchus TaxID=3082113 RepID=A0ACB0DUA9_RANTA|nr:unnamed protein product [Rangifer tarandus platyrhynchus]CAI9691912.1 unnamed protein product [Rangifer tarandus platyrhynchus]
MGSQRLGPRTHYEGTAGAACRLGSGGPAAGLPARCHSNGRASFGPGARPPFPRGPVLPRDARGHSPGPAGGLASDWRAHSAPAVAEPGIPHLEKLFGRRGNRKEVDGGRLGTKCVGRREALLPAAGLSRRETPGCAQGRPREQLLLEMDLRTLSQGQRSRHVLQEIKPL